MTSTTTCVAMLANYFGDIMTIQSFGVFAGVIVPINFLLVVMMFPSAVTFYEKKIKSNKNCICWGEKCTNKAGELGKVEQFCDVTLNNFTHSARWVIMGVSIVWFAICTWQVTEIRPASK